MEWFSDLYIDDEICIPDIHHSVLATHAAGNFSKSTDPSQAVDCMLMEDDLYGDLADKISGDHTLLNRICSDVWTAMFDLSSIIIVELDSLRIVNTGESIRKLLDTILPIEVLNDAGDKMLYTEQTLDDMLFLFSGLVDGVSNLNQVSETVWEEFEYCGLIIEKYSELPYIDTMDASICAKVK